MKTKEQIKAMLSARGLQIAVDLDGTLTKDATVLDYLNKTPNEIIPILAAMQPDLEMIELVNKLAKNNLVYIFTARNDVFQEVTAQWLKEHGVNYEYIVVNKPFYDHFLEDKAITPDSYKEYKEEESQIPVMVELK